MSDEKDEGGLDQTFRTAVRVVAITGAVVTVCAMLASGFKFGAGAFAGAAIAVTNLIVLGRIVNAFLGKKGNTAPWAIIAVLKLLFLLGGVYLILKSGVVSGLALVIGYMSLPVGLVFATLFGPKPPDDSA